MGRKVARAAALLLLPLVLGVADAGGRTLAVSTVTVEVIGKGTITSSPAGIDCGNGTTTCYLAFSGSGTVTLTATAASGWSFHSWTDCPTIPVGNTCDVPVDGNPYTVTVNFSGPPTTTSTLSVTTTGDGNVGGGSIDCGSSPVGSACTWTVLTGSTLTVRQTPAASNVFTGWGGACGGTGVACTVELNGDRSVTAAWASSTGVLLTVSVSGSGTITGGGISCPSTCAATQAMNSTVVLTATAPAGHVFTGWGGACSGTTSPCSVLMDAAKSVTATFAPAVQLTVTVSGNGNISGEAGAINCGGGANLCSATFVAGETVSLTATPATGAAFTGWSGTCGGASTTCTILMNDSKSVTATFTAGPPVTLTVSVAGAGTVSGGGINCGNGATCTATHSLNESVTLAATPGPGATFAGWSGACSGTATTCTVSMTSARTVTASFSGGTLTVPLIVAVGGRGTVTGGGINCGNGGTTCSVNVTVNSSVTLRATPAPGQTFSGWGGGCSGQATTCTLTMSAGQSVSASFSAGAAGTLTIAVTGRGTVSTSAGKCVGAGPRRTCVQRFPAGRRVVLRAIPGAGAKLGAWSGACTGKKTTCAVTLSIARAVNATFVAAILTPLGAPRVQPAGSGFRVSLRFKTTQAGIARVQGLLAGRVVKTLSRQVAAGTVTIGPFRVSKSGSYVFEIRLAGETIRWRKCLGRC